MYITGMPGLGKTACLLKTIADFQKNKHYRKLFDFYYINALKLRTPNFFYSQFWLELTGIKVGSKLANKNLEKFFKNSIVDKKYLKKDKETVFKKLHNIKLLVIDEIDFLHTKN